MKHIKHYMLTVLMAFVSSVSAFAYDFEVDGFYFNTISIKDLTCELTCGEIKYSGEVVIPSSVTYSGKTFNVTSIGQSAFSVCSGLTSVDIPNSVTTIGYYAFGYCTSLTSIVIPNSVKTIEKEAFYMCTGLTSVVIPNSVTTIGQGAFSVCSGLTSIVISNSVSEIESYSFDGCTGLTSVEIPNSVTTIGSRAFAKCTGLSSVVIPNSVKTIGQEAFIDCTGLTSVVIGNSVTTIESEAFRWCDLLTTVVIGNSVSMIETDAFGGCSGLKEITSLAVNPPKLGYKFGYVFIGGVSFRGVSKSETIVKVPEESVEAYKSAEEWQLFWNIVGLSEGGGETPETKVCAAPSIVLVDGKIVSKSATEGAKCYTSVTSEDFKAYDGDGTEAIELSGVYEITSYAHAVGYQNSETVTATLVWVNPTIAGGEDMFNMDTKKAVVISATLDGLRISGTERGELITVYSLEGKQIASVVAESDMTEFACPRGIAVLKIGDKSVKVNVK